MKQKEYESLRKGDIIVFNESTEVRVEGKTIVATQAMTRTNMGDFGKTVLLSPLVKLRKKENQDEIKEKESLPR